MLDILSRRFALLIVILAVAPLGALAPQDTLAAQGPAGNVGLTVVDATTGQPIIGAQVDGPDGLTGVTDSAGQRRARLALPEPEWPISVTVRAPGYGDWTLHGARVLADDTLYLTARLGSLPITRAAPRPAAERGGLTAAELEAALDLPPGYVDQTQWPIPATIRVRVTDSPYCNTSAPYTVQTVDFRQYLKNVLPNEWGASWHRESIRAGAVAVKMYAWYMISLGGKWPDADVYDSTCDQVYNPDIAYASTNAAVDDTFGWRLTRDGKVFPTYYRAYATQCADAGLAGKCLGQWDSKSQADAGATFDQILTGAYVNTRVNYFLANTMLWFNGSAFVNNGRVQIPIDTGARGADVGAADFTLEFWMRALPGQNMAFDATRTPANTCDVNDGWIKGSVVLDRDIVGAAAYGDYGLALAGGRVTFGINNGLAGTTLCGVTDVTDGSWHHVAITRRRSDGWLKIWVDGRLDAEVDGPDGDVSYQDGRTGGAVDPYLVVGGRKIDSDPVLKPSFTGWLDELRFSNSVRYSATFTPVGRFALDAAVTALYRFDDGSGPGACTGSVSDSYPASPAAAGACVYGGNPAGPLWAINDNPLVNRKVWLPIIHAP
ncbi:MAG: hypothetical protein JNL73_12740 [Anaerolineales bacterium]|nr:hypothetical protein [Anaerolineales bacterium]